ncbi:gluconate 2-dehydrogenase subunit 3 family protein [Novosphingobium flavum]|uniref:Gluconate 2-dehydrogenase subunit 3 family protein n=1 Tax=Novosphingobium flavum TaxID=1778672 RepID=A0A7X1KMT6_9SPHN|nr:gluconate 2-dehydrogenase subunit 3 family protein [Novosphingobium flavum]MBC2666703.1 gluconate 2-dehydrogenase subunit 3 family protein [Novosphingobium flavum]
MTELSQLETDRRALLGAAGALAVLMMQPGWIAVARAQEGATRRDPRFAFADRLCDLTIPATDTPGASAAGVPAFVLMALDEGMHGLKPEMLDRVMARLDGDAQGMFLGKSVNVQLNLLTGLDRAAYASRPADPLGAEAAWRRIKSAIVAGYYASEVGASQELVYEPAAGTSENIVMPADYRARSNEGHGGAW